MDNAAPKHQAELTRLYRLAQQDSANGVVAQTARVRLRYWAHWIHFCSLQQLDPSLAHVPDPFRVEALLGFTRHVREGNAGRGNQVRVGSVSTALSAIGTTFELDCKPNPTYQPGQGQTLWRRLRDLLKGYKRADPPTLPQLAVPVTLTEHLLKLAFDHTGNIRHRTKLQTTADLCNIAFYFLLRVGEYTRPRSSEQNVVPFTVQNVTFRDKAGLSLSSSLSHIGA